MTAGEHKDLIVLVADKNMEFALHGILSRTKALAIQPVSYDIRRHPEKDSGCLKNGPEFLANFAQQYTHALLMFDHEGCGQEATSVDRMVQNLAEELVKAWCDRAEVIVIEPELDIWVWSDSPHVGEILGWKDRTSIREWLQLQQQYKSYWPNEKKKPLRPKEVLELTLRTVKKPRSSSLYQALAEKVSLERCTDPSFVKLKTILRRWFGNR